jgi:predicted  nucleic acid-binding Zn-ribbon protein
MTVKLAPYKVSRILVDYLKGLPQPKIAEKNRVNQASVSHYASRLRERVNKIGLVAAGKEFGIMDELDSLRSLAVELHSKGLTVEEAKDGLTIIKAFHKLGIPPGKYAALVEVCGDIEEPDFVKAALRLIELEKATGMSYREVVSQFEKVTSGLNDLDARKNRLQSELAQLEHSVGWKQAELKAAEEGLTQIQKQAKVEQTKLEGELSAQKRRVEDEKMRLSKELESALQASQVTRGEIDAVARLKADLERRGLDLPTLIMLAEEFKDEAEVDTARLKQLLGELRSLEGAVVAKRKQKNTLEEDVAQLRGEYVKLEEGKRAFEKRLETLRSQVAEKNGLLQQIDGMVERRGQQYKLFESFIAMLLTSPSREVTLRELVSSLNKVEQSRWHTVTKPEELRGIFVLVFLGYYLKCFQCGECGGKFILNMQPRHKPLSAPCTCPSCGSVTRVTADESFLEAMLSPGGEENFTREQALQKEVDRLKPLEVFQNIPCATCGKAIHIDRLSREEALRLTHTWNHATCPEPATARIDAAIETAVYRKLSRRFGSDMG